MAWYDSYRGGEAPYEYDENGNIIAPRQFSPAPPAAMAQPGTPRTIPVQGAPAQAPTPAAANAPVPRGTPAAQPGLLGRLFGGDLEDTRRSLGYGMLALSNNPQLQQMGIGGLDKMEAARVSTARTNRTLEALKKMGLPEGQIEVLARDPELLRAVFSEMYKKQFETQKAESSEGKLYADYRAGRIDEATLKEGLKRLAGTGKTDISINMGEGEKDFWKDFRSGEATAINAAADRMPQLVESLNSVQLLRRLGQNLDAKTPIPEALRPYVPKGVSDALDAYNTVAYGVAQSMRIPGSGAQTDKDFEVLVARAGDASLSPAMRAVVQSGLEAAIQMNLDLSRAAQEFRADPSTEARAEYQRKVSEIMNRRLFNKEQLDMLGGVDSAYPEVMSAADKIIGG